MFYVASDRVMVIIQNGQKEVEFMTGDKTKKGGEPIKKNAARKPRGYNKRTEEQREHDLLFCSDLFLRGYTYREITAKLNEHWKNEGAEDYSVSMSMVYYDMKQCLIEWKTSRMDNIDEYIGKELQKLDLIELEAWGAWEKSKNGKTRNKSRTPGSRRARPNRDENETYETVHGYDEETTEDSAGNPRFLELVLSTMQRRAKLLGFDAPISIEETKVSEEPKRRYNFEGVADDDLCKVADALQAKKKKKDEK